MKCKFTVIVPTTAEKKRFQQVIRAINSIRAASSYPVKIIAVVNGNRRDAEVVSWLNSNDDVRVVDVELGSAPNAQRVGRTMVDTEFFAFLDDDDCYLPEALDKRLTMLQESPGAALAVTNGFSNKNGEIVEHYNNIGHIQADPLKYLFQMNWLHNCNHLMRTEMVNEELFNGYHSYFEWTWLAYKIAISGLTVTSTDEMTFVYYDTPGSASKSDNYFKSFPALAEKMLKLNPPDEIKKMIKFKVSAHYHNMADSYLRDGLRYKSFLCHAKSVFSYKGFRYLPFSRHLITDFFTRYSERYKKGV